MTWLDPQTLKGLAKASLCLYWELTGARGLDGLQMAILLIVSSAENVNITEVTEEIAKHASRGIPYANVWNTTKKLCKMGYLTAIRVNRARGQPNMLSITPSGAQRVEEILARIRLLSDSILDGLPSEGHRFAQAISRKMLDTLLADH